MSNNPQRASGSKHTRRSTSLSDRKSSRSTEPKRESSLIRQRRQKSSIAVRGSSIAALVAIVESYPYSHSIVAGGLLVTS